ncbi:hypothetical protein A9R05_44890 (plasmid) [Burkholderia sp. KK1]|nr:hypothetical protein A9R05_44890 [Burkholderia sp. KK1]
MVFFPAFLFAAYANLIIAIRGLVLKGRDGVVAQLHFVCCLVGVLGLLLGFEMVPDPTKGIAGDAYNWSPVAFFGFGAATIALFVARLRKQARQDRRDPLTLRFGTAMLAVLAGLYICGTAVDHWWFFRDSEKAGTAEASFVGKDVNCSSSVLVRLDGRTATYRCPTLIEFGRDYSQPFVPWPSYSQGITDGRHILDALANADAQTETKQAVQHTPADTQPAASGP